MSVPTRNWPPSGLAEAIPRAIADHQFHLYYQPIVSLSDRSTTRLEALPRWNHPEHGLLSPDTFIDLAGQAGILGDLERWALGEALHQLTRWSGGLPGTMSISVNIAREHLLEPGMAEALIALTAEAGAPLGRLGLELSREAIIEASESDPATLRQITDLGIDVTLDGFSAGDDMDAVGDAPLSTIKIGRETISAVPDDPAAGAVVDAAVAHGRERGLGVVATGIESPGQAAWLREAGCHYGQGFLFSVAMPAEVLEERMVR